MAVSPLLRRVRVDIELWIVVVLCLFALWPLAASSGLARGHDTMFHLYRAAEINRGWSHGVVLPQWAESFYFGYGSPVFRYYAYLVYILTAGLSRLFALDMIDAFRALIVLCLPTAGAGMYLFMRQRAGKLAGVIAALCYVYSPYILYREVHVRGDYPELLAFTLFPLVMWRFERVLLAGRGRDISVAALLTGLLVLSHNLMALTLAGLLAGWLAWGALARTLSRAQIVRGAAALALGIGLAAYFWLPVMLERDEVRLSNAIGTASLDYRNSFVDLRALLALPRRTDSALMNGLYIQNTLGSVHCLLALGGLVAALVLLGRARRARRAIPVLARYALFYALVALVLIGLMLPISRWLWDTISGLAYFQFPWRFLGPAAFSLAALAGLNAIWIERLRWRGPLVAGMIAAVIVQAAPLLYVAERWRLDDVDTSSREYHSLEMSGRLPPGTTVSNEFLPTFVHVVPGPTARLIEEYASGYPVDPAHREILPPDVQLDLRNHTPHTNEWQVSAVEPFGLEVLTFYFPGWQARIDGKRVKIGPSEPHGLITFDVPAGTHTVRLDFKATPVRRAANALSLIALAAVIGLALWRRSGPAPEIAPERPLRGWLLAGGMITAVLLALLMREGGAWVRSAPGEAALAQHPVNFTFGDQIQLVGYTLSDDTPGKRLDLDLYWYTLRQPDANYHTFVHISTGGPPLAQADRALPADTLTSDWLPGTLAGDPYTIRLPDDMPPGEYNLTVGLWACEGECPDGGRLPVTDANGDPVGDAALLQTVQVK